jgi:hypothetical protein
MKPIGRDAPWLMPNPDGTFEEFIVSSWVEEVCGCTAMLAVADLESLYALVFHPDGLPEHQLRAVTTDLIVAGITLGDPDLRAAGWLASCVIAGAARRGSEQRQFDPPPEWDGKARVLLTALLRISAGKGRP